MAGRESVCCVLMCCPLLNATVISHRVKGSACTVRQKDAGMDRNVEGEKDGGEKKADVVETVEWMDG